MSRGSFQGTSKIWKNIIKETEGYNTCVEATGDNPGLVFNNLLLLRRLTLVVRREDSKQ